MNDDHLDRLKAAEKRIEKLETDLWSELKDIKSAITAMAINFAQRRDCPQPGLCLQLQARMQDLETDKRDIVKDVLSIQKWQAGIMASLVLIGIIITFFGPAIRHMLNIPQ
ncbi:MAG: hypothetical protein WCS43_11425 [Verrucomicrobiota bacterium]